MLVWNMSQGQGLVVAFFLAATLSCTLTTGSSICLNDSAFPDSGEGEYAPVLLVGRYNMKVDSTNEQFEKLESLAQEQLRLQEKLLQEYHAKPKQVFYRDCEDAYQHGARVNGVYTIQPDNDLPFQVYCDMDTDSGGWTVIQRRKDGSVEFYRDWMDYARGFGNLTREFWLGLRKLHRISALSSGPDGNELRIELEDFEGNTAYAKYESFAIGNSATKYRLSVSRYHGTAGDSLSSLNGQKFTTKDQDNDHSSGSCAQDHTGAWWYNACFRSHLNGPYLNEHHSPGEWEGVYWHHWKGNHHSLKGTEMKVRRQ